MTDIAELVAAGAVLAGEGLVTAFGHVSSRSGEAADLLITPPKPLGHLAFDVPFAALQPATSALPSDAPGESWIHIEIARRRPDVRAICRAQPPTAMALTAAGRSITPLHGQASLLGSEVPVFGNPRLVRDRATARALAVRLGDASVIILRGNGAVTVGSDVGEAVALMWLLESAAVLTRDAVRATGSPRPLDADEQEAWRATGRELLTRIWAWLLVRHPSPRSIPSVAGSTT